jgi:hypothetical protein
MYVGAEAMPKPYFLYLQVKLQILQLFSQLDGLLLFLSHIAPEEVGQLLDHLPSLFGVTGNEGADGIEAVEEEVGSQLLA